MKRTIELLAPGGDIESIKAAIAAGADAVYLGLNVFNARYRATNIEFDDLAGIINLAHRNQCKIFITINIIIIESEIRALTTLLNRLVNTNIDGVIVQDLGLFYLLAKHFDNLKIHASTQLTTHNIGQIRFLKQLGATRVNLSRELNIKEIKALTRVGHENNIESEVFVHGSNCLSFSGICYISSVQEGKSGNRGRCSQPCRDQYVTTPAGNNFPLNLKDNSAFADLKELYDAGVDAVKIEGRMKKFDYVYTVVHSWRNLLNNFYKHNTSSSDDADLNRVFNRDFTNGFLMGNISKDMFIDNPRDDSARHFFTETGCPTAKERQLTKQELQGLRNILTEQVSNKIAELNTAKTLLKISISGKPESPLKVDITADDISFNPFTVHSEARLVQVKQASHKIEKPEGLTHERLYQSLEAINATEYTIADLDLEQLQAGLYLPLKELRKILKKIIFSLKGEKQPFPPIETPRLKMQSTFTIEPTLSVLISSRQQLNLCRETSSDIFFRLPNCFSENYSGWVDLFIGNNTLTPWFPAVLIGKDYTAAVDILQQVKPQQIVTDNTGIAYEAYRRGINWIAGPSLNNVNSFTLVNLKEKFNCAGAFISNELSKVQINKIVTPEDFKLYYSLYHPIVLLTSRQCLFHQIDSCNKSVMDEDCMLNCNRSASITNLHDETLIIDKAEGCYHRIFNQHNFLNTNIVTDLPDRFASFLIDLSEIKTETEIATKNINLIQNFENLLNGNPEAKLAIEKTIKPFTNNQYTKGI